MIRLTDIERDMVDRNRGLAGNAATLVWRKAHRIPDLQDLYQAAILGLCEAARGFDPEQGFKFSTYAGPSCYHAAMREAATQGVIVTPAWHNTAYAKGNPFLAMGSKARYPVEFNVRTHDRTQPQTPTSDDQLDVESMFATIGVEDREMVRRWMQGQPHAAIGDAAGLTETEARDRVWRAIKAMRRRFG